MDKIMYIKNSSFDFDDFFKILKVRQTGPWKHKYFKNLVSGQLAFEKTNIQVFTFGKYKQSQNLIFNIGENSNIFFTFGGNNSIELLANRVLNSDLRLNSIPIRIFISNCDNGNNYINFSNSEPARTKSPNFNLENLLSGMDNYYSTMFYKNIDLFL